jgi:tRNA dimethylallyltransferase
VADHLEGRVVWDDMVRLFKRDTRHYAKRQLTWFKADPDIEWIQPDQTDEMRERVDAFLA